MSELITDETVKAVYDMLRKMPPFNGWKLPQAHEIKFKADGKINHMGELHVKPFKLVIGTRRLCFFSILVTTIAHEMIHLHLYLEGVKSWRQHRKAFRNKALEIGLIFGFDGREL